MIMMNRKMMTAILALTIVLSALFCLNASAEMPDNPAVGDIITFGTYPQTANGTDAAPIEWQVLSVNGDQALVVSRYILDAQIFCEVDVEINWETSALRGWLNGDFYYAAFTKEERARIVETEYFTEENPYWAGYYDDFDSLDRITLMSMSEVETYFGTNEARRVQATDYARSQGVYESNGAACWWLRTMGNSGDFTSYVNAEGQIADYGHINDEVGGVRPMMWVNCDQDFTYEESQTPTVSLSESQPGDYVTFGTYPVEWEGTDETPIEWLVLEADGNTRLLISHYGLEPVKFNETNDNTTWADSGLRSWLNNEFYARAFTDAERRQILLSEVPAEANPEYGTDPGANTQDYVFTLSIQEAKRYFPTDASRICNPTDYAVSQGATRIESAYADEYDPANSGWWWLRTPGIDQSTAALVYYSGGIGTDGLELITDCACARPVIRVDVSNVSEISQEPEVTEAPVPEDTAEAMPVPEDTQKKTYLTMDDVEVGDYVTFGTYPQTREGTDATPIEWQILHKEGSLLFVVSRYALDVQTFAESYETDGWAESSIRSWLNNEFYNRAFTDQDKKGIVHIAVFADGNPYADIDPGEDTTDYVFLLSIREAENYFETDEDRECQLTEYAFAQGGTEYYGNTCWWLRTPVEYADAGMVDTLGEICYDGLYESTDGFAVRPALYVQVTSVELAEEEAEEETESGVNVEIGDSIVFGRYPQTAEGTDETPIEWDVLDVQGNQVLLISSYGLDARVFNDEEADDFDIAMEEDDEGVTWENCSLRSWLNGEFYDTAFTEEERAKIVPTQVIAYGNAAYATEPGGDTTDNVFLLSIHEIWKYYDSGLLACFPTDYALQQGALTDYDFANGECQWWLRTPGRHNHRASEVVGDGSIDDYGEYVGAEYVCVRPLIWVELS